ncbi:MAG: helix-turn-helix domain-containing protein [Lachnospiraceae bacterium]|nr:helix-turn-helix domain-containing protein [Lachnospiraceae bacterium]
MVNMGNKLKALRQQNNYTQKQIAERLGVAISAVSSYESGIRYPSYDSLVTLARIFHVNADYLLGLTARTTIDVSDLDESEIQALESVANALRSAKSKGK